MAARKKRAGKDNAKGISMLVAVVAASLFWLSIQPRQQHFDYTSRIAAAFLHGHLGLSAQPPSWLNEMVSTDGQFYSVFPLGAVLSLIPVALLAAIGLFSTFPGGVVAAVVVGFCVQAFYKLSELEPISKPRRILLALFPIFGTWSWCNLGFAGAWQIALGFALLGETAALYFTLVRPRPLLAGAFFALAFGNRTEIILTAPIFMFWWFFRIPESAKQDLPRDRWKPLSFFLAIPIAFGIATAAYNFARFGSIFDFGYMRIPNVNAEPWYRYGLFSLHAIPWNVFKMLFEGMTDVSTFPFLQPHAFGCSIFLASPFLFLLFREGGRFRAPAWLAIGVLTFALWCHGNPGGWQFSYRYAMILLPWMFLLLLSNGPRTLTELEGMLFLVSIAVNAVAVYQFLWTNNVHP
ncbi:MAG TPA: hypothetical protein VGI60_11600 [Chthoniobacterales bacterium]|jgi:hypothetical protein